MSERRGRFVRSDPAAACVLTARDGAILDACYQYRWLTRPQLQKIVGLPGVGRTNDRLRKLYDARLLERIRAGTVGAGLQPLYLPGEAAVPLLATRTGLPEPVIRERLREDARASAVLLPHDLQVNDVRIALTAGIAAHPRLRFECWLNARECYDTYAPGRSLRPDGYFRFWDEALCYAWFLEVDRGSVDRERWQGKVRRYLEYRESGAYTTRYTLQRFRVLTTVPSEVRLQDLLTATRSITDRNFWFGLTEAVLTDPSPQAAIWQPVGQDERRALIETGG